jgi:hypothetical protein
MNKWERAAIYFARESGTFLKNESHLLLINSKPAAIFFFSAELTRTMLLPATRRFFIFCAEVPGRL